MATPTARATTAGAWLTDGRLHLQDGPIDLIVDAIGPLPARRRALAAAGEAFDGLLAELGRLLPTLRRPVGDAWPVDASPTAERMKRAVQGLDCGFVTPMAAVAGAVADTILAAMTTIPGLEAAYVNNRGDVAIHVTPARGLSLGVVTDLRTAGLGATIRIEAGQGVGGIATSGWRGRSFSLGIADTVTVLAANAAAADAAATVIASAVDAEHREIRRVPARELDPDSDLGARPVTVAVGELDARTVDAALARGALMADALVAAERIIAAFLAVNGRATVRGRDVFAPLRAADAAAKRNDVNGRGP